MVDLDSACFHVAGALPMVFEGPHGAQPEFRFSHAEIVDLYLLVFESLMVAGVREGFRPPLDPEAA